MVLHLVVYVKKGGNTCGISILSLSMFHHVKHSWLVEGEYY